MARTKLTTEERLARTLARIAKSKDEDDGFLTKDSQQTPDEYTLDPNAESVWITDGGLSIRISHVDDEVHVDIFPLDDEFNEDDDEPLASCLTAIRDPEEDGDVDLDSRA